MAPRDRTGVEGERGRVDRRRPADDVAVRHHGARRVDRTRRQRFGELARERGQRDGDHLGGTDRTGGAVGDEHVDLPAVRQHDARAGPPRRERPHDCPPVPGQVERDARGPGASNSSTRRFVVLLTQLPSTAPDSSTRSPASPYQVMRGRPGSRTSRVRRSITVRGAIGRA